MLHVASLKVDEDVLNINDEFMDTQYFLRNTQSSLLESNMEREKLHQELQRSHILFYTYVILSHMDDCIIGSKEEPHVMVEHEEHANLKMFEEDKAFEFPFGSSHTLMDEVEKHDIVKPTSRGVHASTCLVDESSKRLVHNFSPHNFISAVSFGNEE